MNYEDLISRREVLQAELDALEKQLKFVDAWGTIAEIDNHGVLFSETALGYADIPRFIAWLQSLIGEQEPTVKEKPWSAAQHYNEAITAAMEVATRHSAEAKPVKPKPWPVWFANEKGKVVQLVGVIQTSSLVFAAPNHACARDFWIHGDLESYPAFATRWRQNGEEVQP
jgi:hypothetical protein